MGGTSQATLQSFLGTLRGLAGGRAVSAEDPLGRLASRAVDVVWETDRAGRLVEVKAGDCPWPLNHPPDRLLGARALDHVSLSPASRRALLAAAAAGRAFAGITARAGDTILSLSGRPILDLRGRVRGLCGVAMAVPADPLALAGERGGALDRLLAVLDALARRLEAEHAVIYTVAGESLTPDFATSGQGRKAAAWNVIHGFFDSPCGQVVRTGRALVVPERLQDRFPRQACFRRMGIHAFAGLPMAGPQRRTVAVLAVLKARPLAEPEAEVVRLLAAAAEKLVPLLEAASAEKALREQAERLGALLGNLPGMAYRVRIGAGGLRRYLFASEGAAAVLGLSPAELLALPPERLAELRHPDDRAASLAKAAARLAQGEPSETTFRLMHPRRGIRWVVCREKAISQNGNEMVVDGMVFDITEEVEAKQALERSEAELRAIADYTIDWESWLDADGRVRWVNPGVAPITGWSVAECLEMRGYPHAMVHEEDRGAFTAMLAAAARGEAVEDRDIRFLRRRGDWFWGSLSVRAIKPLQGGLPMGLRTTVRDIGPRKRAEQALKQREGEMGRVLAALDLTREGVVVTDLHGHVVYANEAAAAFIRPGAGDGLKGRHWRELGFAPEAASGFLDTIASSLDSRGSWKGEVAMHMGTEAALHLDTRFARLPEGGFIAVLSDITERKRSEQQMRESEERYRALFGSAGDAIFLMEGARIIDCNPRAAELFWRRREDMIGEAPHRFSPAFQPDGRLSEEKGAAMLAATMAGEPQNYEWVHERPDGTAFHVEVSLTSVARRGRPYIFSLVRDITERRRREEQQRRLEQQLQQARKLEALGQLAGGVAHDFNNLLGAILGFSQFIMEDSAPGSGVHRHAERIALAGERAKGLVRQILTFSRRGEVARTAFDLGQLAVETEGLLRASLPSSTRLEVDTTGEPLVVDGDRVQIGQVALNLCINANDALGDRPGVVRLTVQPTDPLCPGLARLADRSVAPELVPTTELWRDGEGWAYAATGGYDPSRPYLSLVVSDSGQGMEPQVLERIFEPFFTTKDKGRGTGLGLAVVHSIVIHHGGAMVVRSRPGHGTEFQVALPRSQEIPAAEAPGEWGGAPVAALRGRVLVVDDDVDFGDMLVTALERRGFEVAPCGSARDALEIFEEDPEAWDVLVTDQTMPEMRGIDLVRAVRAIRPDLHCIICTGYSTTLTEASAAEAGAMAVVHKPVELDALVAMVARAVKEAQRPRP